MPKRYPAKEIIHTLERAGFEHISQRGSHIKLRKQTPSGKLTVIIPNYKEIAAGVFSSILRQAKMSKEEFLKLLKK